MTLSTLVVSEAGKEKLAEIETLVGANTQMSLVATATMDDTFEKIRQTNPRIVWIDLSPSPGKGIKLLVGLKEEFPTIHCLVSNDELDAALVKTSMQSGAVDFLDAKTWNDQLPDVISRIVSKEAAQNEARERLEADRAKMREVLEAQKAQTPTASKTNLASMKKMVTDSREIESRAKMNLALIVVIILIVIGAIFFLLKH